MILKQDCYRILVNKWFYTYARKIATTNMLSILRICVAIFFGTLFRVPQEIVWDVQDKSHSLVIYFFQFWFKKNGSHHPIEHHDRNMIRRYQCIVANVVLITFQSWCSMVRWVPLRLTENLWYILVEWMKFIMNGPIYLYMGPAMEFLKNITSSHVTVATDDPNSRRGC